MCWLERIQMRPVHANEADMQMSLCVQTRARYANESFRLCCMLMRLGLQRRSPGWACLGK